MRRFLVRRAVFAAFTLWGVTIIVFILSRLGPDPLLMFVRDSSYGLSEETAAALRSKWGLDRPLVFQYGIWLGRVARGDLGESISSGRKVTTTIRETIGNTVQLGVAAWIVATVAGVPLGVLSAVKRGGVWDYLGRTIALLGQATPPFWLALLAILVFAIGLGWLPVATKLTEGSIWAQARYFVLPTVVLAFHPMATYLRLTRSAMLEVLDSEYVKLARAKGVNRPKVIWKHAFRNALIQPVTTSALVFASFITGAIFVESVFAWPGLGRLAARATFDNDFPVIAGVVLLFGWIYLVLNFLADMSYVIIDPRIRLD